MLSCAYWNVFTLAQISPIKQRENKQKKRENFFYYAKITMHLHLIGWLIDTSNYKLLLSFSMDFIYFIG